MKRKYLSLAIGVVLVAPAMPAWSQEEAGGSPAEVKATQLDTVTVTARKREETLQDVPVAVTAFTPEALDTLNIKDLATDQVARELAVSPASRSPRPSASP